MKDEYKELLEAYYRATIGSVKENSFNDIGLRMVISKLTSMNSDKITVTRVLTYTGTAKEVGAALLQRGVVGYKQLGGYTITESFEE